MNGDQGRLRLRHMLDRAEKIIAFTQATRNRLIHGYFDIDLNVVWRIVREDVPVLVNHLRAIM